MAAAAGLFAGAIAHTAVHSLHSNTTAMDKFVAEYKRQVVSFLEQPTSEERKGLLHIAAVRLAIYAYVVKKSEHDKEKCIQLLENSVRLVSLTIRIRNDFGRLQ